MKLDGHLTISARTAKIALDNLSDWLSDAWELNPETRSMVIALDELVTALDAEQYLATKEQEREEANRKFQEEWRERKAAEESAKLDAAVAEFLGKGGN
jgi:hypothetical protein